MASATTDRSTENTTVKKRKSEWTPRIWEGIDFFAWMRILWRNRFAVDFAYWYIAIIVAFVSVFHSLLRWWQEAAYGRIIRRVKIDPPPLFILGHWRTGTTLLHELFILDPRHAYPTTYQCLAPNHFILTERLFTRMFHFLLPERRPMDNMRAGFDRPQEEEFALCMLGEKSPYLTIAFPNHPPQCQEYFDLENISKRELKHWKDTFVYLLQQITYQNPKRLVLKSPPHTCRIPVLQQLFPNALFVNIVRNPFVVYPSTVNLWKTLYQKHGLQRPKYDGLEEFVFEKYLHLHERFEETRHLIDPARFYQIKYEDLVADPVESMRAIYEHLQLGQFDAYLPKLQEYLIGVKNYKTNKYKITPQQRDDIKRRLAPVFARYGYNPEECEKAVEVGESRP